MLGCGQRVCLIRFLPRISSTDRGTVLRTTATTGPTRQLELPSPGPPVHGLGHVPHCRIPGGHACSSISCTAVNPGAPPSAVYPCKDSPCKCKHSLLHSKRPYLQPRARPNNRPTKSRPQPCLLNLAKPNHVPENTCGAPPSRYRWSCHRSAAGARSPA